MHLPSKFLELFQIQKMILKTDSAVERKKVEAKYCNLTRWWSICYKRITSVSPSHITSICAKYQVQSIFIVSTNKHSKISKQIPRGYGGHKWLRCSKKTKRGINIEVSKNLKSVLLLRTAQSARILGTWHKREPPARYWAFSNDGHTPHHTSFQLCS